MHCKRVRTSANALAQDKLTNSHPLFPRLSLTTWIPCILFLHALHHLRVYYLPHVQRIRYDVMGDGHTAHAEFSAGYKRRLVYIGDDEAMSVDTSTPMASTAVRLFSHDHAKPTGDVTLTITANKNVPWTEDECPCAATADKYCWYPAGGYCDLPTYSDPSSGKLTCYPGADVDCSVPNTMYVSNHGT